MKNIVMPFISTYFMLFYIAVSTIHDLYAVHYSNEIYTLDTIAL